MAARTEWHQKAGLAVAERNGADPALRVQRWPVLAPEAHYGLPGDVVETIEPHSEADRAANKKRRPVFVFFSFRP